MKLYNGHQYPGQPTMMFWCLHTCRPPKCHKLSKQNFIYASTFMSFHAKMSIFCSTTQLLVSKFVPPHKCTFKLCILFKSLPCICLGPIARPQLGTCLCHSEATAHLHSPLIIAYIVYHHHSHYMINNKDTSWTTTTTTFICTLRHGGSAEPALPTARKRIRLVSEKEKRNSQGIHLCSQMNHCPKGKTSYIRIFVQKTGSH